MPYLLLGLMLLAAACSGDNGSLRDHPNGASL